MNQQPLSVVIPVYNAESTLSMLIEKLRGVLEEINGQHEIILVDDGSRDQSWSTIQSLTKADPRVRGIALSRNYGQHNALLCGIRSARFPIIVTLDDDLQNPPEEIPRLLAGLKDEIDVVYGTPQKEKHTLLRALASRITKMALQGAMGAATARSVSAFRGFRTSLRDSFAAYNGPFVSIDVLLTWGTRRFSAIPVRQDPRHSGESNYTFQKLLAHALNMMTGFSILPLQIASWIGFSFTLFGFVVLLFVIGRFLIQGGSVPGFPFLASIIAIFSGAQLFALGIIGEYLARIHYRTMGKPSYSVAATTFDGKTQHEGDQPAC